MIIGIDFDDVLLDCNTSLAEFHNARYGTSYTRDDVRSWFLEDVWKCTQEEARARIREWHDSPFHDGAAPMPHACEAMHCLSRKHELHVITARLSAFEPQTRRWLARNFPAVFREVHFTDYFGTRRRSKAEVCKTLAAAVLIEDALVHAREAAAAGVATLLLDAPWNQGPIPERVVRLRSWPEIVHHIELLER